MRIGFQSVYTNFIFNQQNTQNELQKITKELSSGRKIQFGYEGSSIFIDTLRLDYEEATLKQTKDVAEKAKKFSDNTDTSLSQFVSSLENFKIKLVQAANEIHSDESLNALADDLKAIKKHLISVANTSVGGQYVFSGSRVNVRPIGDDGTYYGDDKELKALIGSNNLLPYNINGYELFLGKDSDVSRKITTNVKQLNQELLHPEIMSEQLKDWIKTERFIKETDTLRALIGDYDDNSSNAATKTLRTIAFGGAVNEAALLSNFQAVTNGSLTIVADGNSVALSGLNFSSATSLSDVAKIIQAAYDTQASSNPSLPFVTVTWNENSKAFDFNISKQGANLAITNGGGGTDLMQNGYLGLVNTLKEAHVEYFYIRGRRPDGTTFKSRFDLRVDYADEADATKIRDLLDRIGVEFGNTTLNKVVEVKLNEWGQIEIKDYQTGRSMIDFQLIGSNMAVNNIDELIQKGAKIKEFVKSNYYGVKSISQATSAIDYYDHRIHIIDSTLKLEDNSFAKPNDKLIDVFGNNIASIRLSGVKVNNGGNVNIVVPTAGLKMQDLLDTIKQNFSQAGPPYDDIEVKLVDGKITIIDKSVSYRQSGTNDKIYDGVSSFKLTINTYQDIAATIPANGFANDYSVEFDRVRFEKNGSKLLSNNPQIKTFNSQYATLDTKLSEVASTQKKDNQTGQLIPNVSLHGTQYKMSLKDINGISYSVDINFNNNIPPGTTYTIYDSASVAIGTYTLYDAYDATTGTAADKVTYKQLTDVITITMNFSNLKIAGIFPTSAQNYKNALEASMQNVEVSLDNKGRLYIHDKTSAYTKAEFSIYDAASNDFSNLNTNNKFRPMLTFHANNALVIDDPHVDVFAQLQMAIDAVEYKIYRPDGYNGEKDKDYYTRNIGIQNSLESIEHLLKHINKLHAKNGSQGNAFKYAIERNELLIVQVKTLKSNVLDSDIAEVSLNFSQLSLNYQAMLSTIAKINNMSLVNYLR